MARKAKDSKPEKTKKMYAVFFNLSSGIDFILVKSFDPPVRENEGDLVFYTGDYDDNYIDQAVFKEWMFYKEVQEEDLDGLNEWVDSQKR